MLKFLSPVLFLANLIALAVTPAAQAAVTTRCQIQPRPNQPSPLAMRAGLNVEEADGTVTFKYQNFQTPVSADQPPVTIAQERTMIFYNTTLAAARQHMVNDPKYFNELRGFTDPQTFKPFNDLLVCESTGAKTPQPNSTKPQTESTIADLADGSYRFWNGAPSINVTDQQILAGAATFLFEKTGSRVVGYFARPDDFVMCMTGNVTGNTIKGVVNPPPMRFSNGAARKNKPFDPAGYLQLGAWDGSGNLGSYSPSTLDLSKFTRINLGSRRAPSICR